MDRRVTPSKRVTSPTWGTPLHQPRPQGAFPGLWKCALGTRLPRPPCKQTLTHKIAQKLSRTPKEL